MPDWIYTENLLPLLQLCSEKVGYHFDEADEEAVRHGLGGSDRDQDRWFEYPLLGEREVVVRLAQDPGSSVVHVDLASDGIIPDFIDGLITAMQRFWLSRSRADYEDRWTP